MASDPNPGKPVYLSDHESPTTPVKISSLTFYRFIDKSWGHDELYPRLAAEMSPYFVGPMPVVDFLSDFLLLSTSKPVPSFTPHMFTPVVSQANEVGMYDPFVSP